MLTLADEDGRGGLDIVCEQPLTDIKDLRSWPIIKSAKDNIFSRAVH